MHLLVDIGNSQIKWGLHQQKEKNSIYEVGRARYSEAYLPQFFSAHWADLPKPNRVIIANVSSKNLVKTLDTWIEKHWNIQAQYLVTNAYSHGVYNSYADHTTLGIDRWMAMIAAWHKLKHHKNAICVIDCGTATTIDGLSGYGKHLGGIIFPGHIIMQEILTQKTVGIKNHKQLNPDYQFADNTELGLNNGCALATIATIQHVFSFMQNKYDKATRCIITGGNAVSLMPELTIPFEYEPALVLNGIAISCEKET